MATPQEANQPPTAAELTPSDQLLLADAADHRTNHHGHKGWKEPNPFLHATTGSSSTDPAAISTVTLEEGSSSRRRRPQKQPRPKKSPEEKVQDMEAEWPDWLPTDWNRKFSIRSSGRIDKFYYNPAGEQFRSEIRAQNFLGIEGTRKKHKAEPKSSSGGRQKRESGADTKSSDYIYFDHENGPESVCWTWFPSKDKFEPSIDDESVSESTQQEWAIVFDCIMQGIKPIAP